MNDEVGGVRPEAAVPSHENLTERRQDMKNNVSFSDPGFRFPANQYARIYVAEPENGIIVRLMMLREDKKATLQMDILQELESGLLRIMARRFIPCIIDDDGYLYELDDRYKKSIKYRTVNAEFGTNKEGQIELQITHKENDEIVIDRFTS